MDLAALIRRRVHESVRRARPSGPTAANVAVAANVGGEGHSTSMYSDEHITIVERDGQTHVIRHRRRTGR